VSSPKDKCIHQLREQIATESSNRVALVCNRQRLTHSELNARALDTGATPEIPLIMKHLVTCTTDRPLEASAEFRVGLRSVPYLADHGFQDMAVLPGSFYIEMALCVDRQLSKSVPAVVRSVTFNNPIVLSAEDTAIKVEVKDHGDGRVVYVFYEAGVGDGNARSAAQQHAAKLEIDRNQSTSLETGVDAFSIAAFQAQFDAVIDSERFYETLRKNGNHYGPHFQNVSSIWRMDDQCLGRLSVARQHTESHYLHPSLLDSMTQLLAPFIMEEGKTFILRSIEKVQVMDLNFPATLWCHATRLSESDGDGKGIVGHVRVFDQSGKLYLKLSGVAFTLLNRVDVANEKAAANLVIAANFSAEPLEDSLKFWADYFGVHSQIEFAPYNQIFQQLLDTRSALRRNSDGANVILLSLEEWAMGNRHAVMDLDKERAEQCFGDRPRSILPNGLEIVQLNQYETDYLYKEIFEDQCYLKHGIQLKDGATVVDIGANIGLFSLFVMSRYKEPKIYAFEPASVVYDLLQANCNAYGSNVRALNVGVSDKAKTATFTFYEKSSVFSGFHPDETEDRAAIQTVVRNMLNNESVGGESVEEYVSELTADRLRRRTHECRMTSVSDIMRENQIDKIDLLKIDAEKSELDIIKGIEDHDWPKIEQIVIEIHDCTHEAVRRIEHLLIERGYRCAVEQETLLEHAGFFNLYATRVGAGGETRFDAGSVEVVATETDQALEKAGSLKRNIQDFCSALRSFMDQSTVPLVLSVSPRAPATQADAELKAALNDAEEALLSEARAIANVYTIGSTLPLQHYPVYDYYDPFSHHVGQVPYTPECYAAIGTEIVRTIFDLKRAPFKVIVLDCDNTLWKGICGEDGPLGIEVTPPYRRLQEFMIGQMNAGMLLCLCSKNNEKDVLDVFDQRTDMLLKREHLVSWRINWDRKSENVKSLANELNLGLDSFIFIDDNPVDCADVKINCPDVLTLQLPRHAESFSSFLNHIWAFDHTSSTEEDRNRTRMYQESAKRQQYLEQSFSLKDFVKGLQLRIEITEATEDQLGRVSQQTFRTNQFNFTTIRRSENEIKDFLKREHATCLVVRVADRFGDYGLVGVLMYESEGDRYKMDSLLLSCRVLGRGVEHALVSHLGQRAVKEGKRLVEFTYLPTGKNFPALEFITSVGDQYRNEAATCWTFPAERLATVAYDSDEKAPIAHALPAAVNPEKPTLRPAPAFGVTAWSERLQRIGEDLYDIDLLAKAIEKFRLGKRSLDAIGDVTPGGTLETALTNIWRKVLGRQQIGINDNFFDAGGTSLKAVQVIAMIKRELKQTLSIVSLFECPTLALLAAKLSATSVEAHGGSTTTPAALRGQQRRYNTMRRKVS
jgi:FkbH-like protein/FkbM family methyltransferase